MDALSDSAAGHFRGVICIHPIHDWLQIDVVNMHVSLNIISNQLVVLFNILIISRTRREECVLTIGILRMHMVVRREQTPIRYYKRCLDVVMCDCCVTLGIDLLDGEVRHDFGELFDYIVRIPLIYLWCDSDCGVFKYSLGPFIRHFLPHLEVVCLLIDNQRHRLPFGDHPLAHIN